VARRGVAVEVTGAKELAKAFKGAEPGLIKELRLLHRRIAGIVADDARQRAPRRSGALAGSIRVGGSKVAAFVIVGDRQVPYSGPIHFGWNRHSVPARGIRGGPIAPNPFLWDALDARREEVAASYLRQVNALVTDMTHKGA
jgi:hypothetical protein